jgi:glycosyltransferase involved in cell wall biosynthesis
MPTSPQKIRVLRVITRMNIGGAALHVQLLTDRLDKSVFETRLVAGPVGEHEGDMTKFRGGEDPLRVTLLPTLVRNASPRNDFAALRSLVHLMRDTRPHLVDTHLSKAGFLGRIAARLARVPAVIHTFHIHVFSGYDISFAERQVFLRMEQIAARCCDRMLTLTDDLQREILDLDIGRPEQFRTIPLGLDLAQFRDAPDSRAALRQELGLPLDTPLVGHISRLVPIKSVNYFIEAAAQVRQQVPNAVLLVIGDGESRPELEKLAAEKGLLGDAVRFLGFRSDMTYLNKGLDCIALTSLQEGTPVSIIENLAAGKPVVATDVGGVSRLIQHDRTGWLAPSRDFNKIAEGITTALTRPETAARWGAEGQKHAFQNFDVSRMIADHRALYAEVLQEKNIAVPS